MHKRAILLRNGRELWFLTIASYLNRSKQYLEEKHFNRIMGSVRARDPVLLLRAVAEMPITVYGDVVEYCVKSQLVALVKKYDYTRMPIVSRSFLPEAAAIKKFLAAEHSCRRINQRFRAYRKTGRWNPHHSVLNTARRWIQDVIGLSPDLPKIYALCDFGPGASIGVASNAANLGRKLLAAKWSCTRTALSYCVPALWANDQLKSLILGPEKVVCYDYSLFREKVIGKVQFVKHNNIAFVPKSYKTHRSIAVEPLLNGYLQKGVDQYMRYKLLGVGVNLADQQSNADLAKVGSITGEFSTIDLSSASDSLSIELVRELLPPDWFEFLNNIRSRFYQLDGCTFEYSKFVSMGNGFCFPLQTLIFKSLVYAISRETGSRFTSRVYGDDIIVNKSDSLYLLEVLRYCGFSHNPDKTFIVGYFRESCGADWYAGLAVRPVYLSHEVVSIPMLMTMHNQLRRGPCSHLFDEARAMLIEACPVPFRFFRFVIGQRVKKEILPDEPFEGTTFGSFEVPKDLFMTGHGVRFEKSTWAWSWKEFVVNPIRDRSPGDDPFLCNFVEYLAVLRGSLSSCPLSRRRNPRVSVRRKSYWGTLIQD